MDTRSDVVVVGGGLAGLAAAAWAARGGARVLLLERSGQPGGRARTREQAGFLFNVGPHALYRRGPGMAVLRELGVPVAGRVPAAAGLALRDGRAHTLPATPASLLATRLLSVRGKLQVAGLLGRLRRGAPFSRPGATLAQWMAEQGLRPDAAALLRALVRLTSYSDDPERVDAAAVLHQLHLGLAGSVLYIDGGWDTLVQGLRRAAERAGARVITGAAAEGLESDGSVVRAVRDADGTVHQAGAVILAVPPAEAARLASALSPALAAAAGRAIPVRAATLDLGLRRLPRPVNFALGLDQPLYFSVHSATARLAPDGAALVHALRYQGSHPPPPADAERELEQMMDLVQPGWRQEVIVRRFVPDLTVTGALPTADGGGLRGRLPVALPDVRGLFAAGDWVGSEGMLADASLASGRRAAEAALSARPAEAAA